MTYEGFIGWLCNIPRFTKKNGLENMAILMNRLDNPQDKIRVIHVAGTNGKGSVSAILSEILSEHGYKVGLFTSPHLVEFTERLKINQEQVAKQTFLDVGLRIKDTIDQMVAEGESHPTFFEIMTAMAYLYFYEENVDFAIIEVGIGGRLDATNVVKKPVLSIITSIGLDHIGVLGKTIEEITREKCGIIKKTVPVVLSINGEEVYNIVESISKERNSPLYFCNNIEKQTHLSTLQSQSFSIVTDSFEYKKLTTNLVGEYQQNNIATALLAVEILKKSDYPLKSKIVMKAISQVRWEGRMELVQKNPSILIEGAHNKNGAEALMKSLNSLTKNNNNTLMVSFLKDKDVSSILKEFLRQPSLWRKVIFVTLNSPRAMTFSEFKNMIKELQLDTADLIIEHQSVENAIEKFNCSSKQDDLMVCTGSLYLAGEIKAYYNSREGLLDD